MRRFLTILIASSLCTSPNYALAVNDGVNARIDSTIAEVNRMLSRDERNPAAWGLTEPDDVKVWNRGLKQVRSFRPAMVERQGRIVTIRAANEDVVVELINVEKGLFKVGAHTVDISKAQNFNEIRKILAQLPQFKSLSDLDDVAFKIGIAEAYAAGLLGWLLVAVLAVVAAKLLWDSVKPSIAFNLLLPHCAAIKSKAAAGSVQVLREEAQQIVEGLEPFKAYIPECTSAKTKQSEPKVFNSPRCAGIRLLISCLDAYVYNSRGNLGEFGASLEGTAGEFQGLTFQTAPPQGSPKGGGSLR